MGLVNTLSRGTMAGNKCGRRTLLSVHFHGRMFGIVLMLTGFRSRQSVFTPRQSKLVNPFVS